MTDGDPHHASRTYIVRAALSVETNDSWIWLQETGQESRFGYRTIVVIRRPGCCRAVYTQVRNIDENFRCQYNPNESHNAKECRRIEIKPNENVIVMAEWYRKALGIERTSPENPTDRDKENLIIQAAPYWRLWDYPPLRAACHHPDFAIRLGTRLGVLSVWLALFSVWLALPGLSTTVVCGTAIDTRKLLLFLVLLALAYFAYRACRGPRLAVE